jgi:hypothetical protein
LNDLNKQPNKIDNEFLKLITDTYQKQKKECYTDIENHNKNNQIEISIKHMLLAEFDTFYFKYVVDNRCRIYVKNIPINYQLNKLVRSCIIPVQNYNSDISSICRKLDINIKEQCIQIINDSIDYLIQFMCDVNKQDYKIILNNIKKNIDETTENYLKLYQIVDLIIKLNRSLKNGGDLYTTLTQLKQRYQKKDMGYINHLSFESQYLINKISD